MAEAQAVLEGVELSAANVEAAVLQFYRSGATQETHKWLTLAQLSPGLPCCWAQQRLFTAVLHWNMTSTPFQPSLHRAVFVSTHQHS